MLPRKNIFSHKDKSLSFRYAQKRWGRGVGVFFVPSYQQQGGKILIRGVNIFPTKVKKNSMKRKIYSFFEKNDCFDEKIVVVFLKKEVLKMSDKEIIEEISLLCR